MSLHSWFIENEQQHRWSHSIAKQEEILKLLASEKQWDHIREICRNDLNLLPITISYLIASLIDLVDGSRRKCSKQEVDDAPVVERPDNNASYHNMNGYRHSMPVISPSPPGDPPRSRSPSYSLGISSTSSGNAMHLLSNQSSDSNTNRILDLSRSDTDDSTEDDDLSHSSPRIAKFVPIRINNMPEFSVADPQSPMHKRTQVSTFEQDLDDFDVGDLNRNTDSNNAYLECSNQGSSSPVEASLDPQRNESYERTNSNHNNRKRLSSQRLHSMAEQITLQRNKRRKMSDDAFRRRNRKKKSLFHQPRNCNERRELEQVTPGWPKDIGQNSSECKHDLLRYSNTSKAAQFYDSKHRVPAKILRFYKHRVPVTNIISCVGSHRMCNDRNALKYQKREGKRRWGKLMQKLRNDKLWGFVVRQVGERIFPPKGQGIGSILNDVVAVILLEEDKAFCNCLELTVIADRNHHDEVAEVFNSRLGYLRKVHPKRPIINAYLHPNDETLKELLLEMGFEKVDADSNHGVNSFMESLVKEKVRFDNNTQFEGYQLNIQ